MLLRIRFQDLRGIVGWVKANRHNLYQRIISKMVIYSLHLLRHHWTNTWAGSEKEIYKGNFSLHLRPSHALPILIDEGEFRDIMLRTIFNRTFLKWIVHPILIKDRYVEFVFSKALQKQEDQYWN